MSRFRQTMNICVLSITTYVQKQHVQSNINQNERKRHISRKKRNCRHGKQKRKKKLQTHTHTTTTTKQGVDLKLAAANNH